jgi:energy-coupling factor transporter ATP-binding protein EcfA2
MKQIITLSILFLSLSLLGQEVPNGGFEEWESTPQFTYDPVDWETDNNQLQVSTSPDEDAYEGQYAMMVEPIPLGVGDYGSARCTVPMSGVPDALNFHAKWWQTVTAALGVNVYFYNNDDLMYSEYWITTDTASAWTSVTLPFEPIDIALTHGVIEVFAAVGDLVPGDGWISVDAMNFGNPTSVTELSDISVTVFPNPANQFLELKVNSEQMIDELAIMDLNGRIVLQISYEQRLDVSTLPEGQYLLELRNEGMAIGRKPIVVKR